jgi:hypothetical protein
MDDFVVISIVVYIARKIDSCDGISRNLVMMDDVLAFRK